MKEKKEIILKILNEIFEISEKNDIDKFSKIEVQIYAIRLVEELDRFISPLIKGEDSDRDKESKKLPPGLYSELEQIFRGLM